jgi:tellurite resistance protein
MENRALEHRYARQAEAGGGRPGRERLRAELAAELAIENHALLEALIELGITPETAPAFEALPLVEVAWADGDVAAEERWRVLAGATAFGLELGRPAHAQLELWLARRPPQELLDAWHVFAALGPKVRRADPRARRVLKEAHEVAAAAGGLFGLGSVSGSERTAVARICEALGGNGSVHVA